MDIDRRPHLGGTAPEHATRTQRKLADWALAQTDGLVDRTRLLDVGCGNGFITERVAARFESVVGIDVEPDRLEAFRTRVADDKRYRVMRMPSERLDLVDESVSMVTSFEVLEHVEDVRATLGEMARVLRRGGRIVVSVPQVLFPFETHGVQIGGRVIEGKVPLLPYVPPLHRRFSLARVFGSRELDALFAEVGLVHLRTGYASPQFERSAARGATWESRVAFLRGALDALASVPYVRRLVGVSMLKAYQKE